jgi:hypothetical protein
MRRLAAAALVLVAAAALAGTARADGDPASDYLLGSQVFLPFDAKIPQAKQQELIGTLAAVNRAGYKIRAAVIWSSYDLGAITALWRKPQTYARFLGEEIRFVYSKRLLIVMPNGFGYYWHGHPGEPEQALLSKIEISPGAVGLVDAAQRAVLQLAEAAGVQVDVKKDKSPSLAHERLIIILVSVGAVALLVLLRLALRGRKSA